MQYEEVLIHVKNTCPISLQDASCRDEYCETAFACWNGAVVHCCFSSYCEYETKGCFPSNIKLRLEDGNSVVMSELQVGDRVQTGLL